MAIPVRPPGTLALYGLYQPRLRHFYHSKSNHGLASQTHTCTARYLSDTHRLHSTHRNQVLALPDGRTLGFAEYGASRGKTLFYFHGFPSCRHEAQSIHDFARQNNVRIISLDRPGYGLSSPQPHRNLLDWAKDVEAFAKAKALKRFAIMGTSGGGPFAVACAYALPRDMLSGVGLFASGPPWAAGVHHMSAIRRLCRSLAIYAPGGLRLLVATILALTRGAVSTPFVRNRIDTWLEAQEHQERNKKDDEMNPKLLTIDRQSILERRRYLLDLTIGEPFIQGTSAMVLEAKILSADDWGFRLEDVLYGPIVLWHGAKDVNAPIETIRYLVEKLPRAVLQEFPDDTHYTMGRHLEEAIAQLMAFD